MFDLKLKYVEKNKNKISTWKTFIIKFSKSIWLK